MADEQQARVTGRGNEKVGEVVSDKMRKTIVVEVTRRVPHPVYKRIVTRRKKFYAHDEQQTAKTGDTVRIVESRPMSSLKRWTLGEVIRRAVQVSIEPSAIGLDTPATVLPHGEEEAIMIGMRTILEVADNSGARKLSCILPRGGDKGLHAGLGDIVTAAVKEAAPESAIKKGKVVRCVIVRMRKETRRKDGTYIRFDSNAAVLVSELGEPVGTRVFGPVARELREKRFMKIVSLAPEVL